MDQNHCTNQSPAGDSCGACDGCQADLAAVHHKAVELWVWNGMDYRVVTGKVDFIDMNEGELVLGLVGDNDHLYRWDDVKEVRA